MSDDTFFDTTVIVTVPQVDMTLDHNGAVLIRLHCFNPYTARVLYDDIADRMRTKQIVLTFGGDKKSLGTVETEN